MSRKSPLLAGSSLERLLHWCRNRGDLDVPAIETFLRLLQPTPSLAGLPDALENIKNVHPILDQASTERWGGESVAAFLRLANVLVQHPELVRSLASDESGRPARIEGGIALHPMYSALMLRLPADRPDVTAGHREAFLWLQAYFLDAAAKTHDPVEAPLDEHGAQTQDWGRYFPAVVAAERSVRYVARKTCPIGVLDLVPTGRFDRHALYSALKEAAQTSPAGQSQRFAQRLESFFALADRHRPLRASSSRSRGAPSGDGDDDRHITEIEWTGDDGSTVISKVPSKDAARIQNAGLALEDAHEVTRNFDSGDTIEVKVGDCSVLARERTASAMRSIAKRAQLLPYSSDRLSPLGLDALISAIADLSSGSSAKRRPESLGLEVAAYLALCLWTGIEAERVLETRLIFGDEPAAGRLQARYPYIAPLKDCFSPPVNVLRSPAQAEPHWIEDGLVEAVVPRLMLPMHPMAHVMIEPHVSRLLKGRRGSSAAEKRTIRLFDPKSATELASTARRLVARLTNAAGSDLNLNLSRINRHMYLMLARTTGDLADAAWITGRKPHEISSALHYYSPRTAHLRQAYLEASDELERTCLRPHGLLPLPRSARSTPPPVDERVGARILLKDDYLRALVRRLVGRVTSAAQALTERRSAANWVAYHNHLTTYCVLQLCFCTGIRVIDHPFGSPDDLDPTTRTLVIADKIHAHASSTRIVWLTEACDAQISAYREHLASLGEYLAMAGRIFAQGLAADSPGHRGANLPAGRRPTRLRSRGVKTKPKTMDQQPSLPLFFYLTEFADNWEKVGESTLRRNLIEFHPIPVNAHRHYLRTRLRELGVPGEAVDTFMGHGGIGHEPFGKFSSLSPADLREATLPAVETLMDRAGWVVLPGNPSRYPR